MALPSSPTDIVNLALDSLGEQTINNINDTSNSLARKMSRWYDVCVEDIQTMVIWDELYTYNKPSFITDSYAGVDGQYQYIVPENFIQVIEVNARSPQQTLPGYTQNPIQSTNFQWKLQDGYIIARVENFEMLYARRELDVSKWSNQMRELIVAYIAMKISLTITQSPQIKQDAERDYQMIKNRVLATRQNRARNYRSTKRGFNMTGAKASTGTAFSAYRFWN